jgi:hypothetical protein
MSSSMSVAPWVCHCRTDNPLKPAFRLPGSALIKDAAESSQAFFLLLCLLACAEIGLQRDEQNYYPLPPNTCFCKETFIGTLLCICICGCFGATVTELRSWSSLSDSQSLKYLLSYPWQKKCASPWSAWTVALAPFVNNGFYFRDSWRRKLTWCP